MFADRCRRAALAAMSFLVALLGVVVPASTADAAVGWAQVSAGLDFTCGIKTDRTLWCWGNNRSGQLGVGDAVDRSVPAKVATGNWASVSAGNRSTCALKTDGTRYCWGANYTGEL